MSTTTINSKRLAKNTLFLYFRMFIIMVVTFFTTRVVLQVLGVTDYGIYNTVAGVVVLFAFLNNAMVTTTQRFLNYYLGKSDDDSVALCFSMSLIVHVAIGLILVILAEGVGLWFIHYKMSLPTERMNVALWTLHLAALTSFVNVVKSPYNACLIAYEKMDFYAYISIFEAILKLAIVYMLSLSTMDKLMLYGIMLFSVSLIVMLMYKLYCNKHYEISKYKFSWDKPMFLNMFQFSGFSLLGNAANAGTQQGISMIVNVFAGVTTNAAIGVSNQLSHGIYNFITNFQVAFNPTLVKTYAQNEFEQLKNLIYRVSRYSFFLMFIISLPVIVYCENFLDLWLGTVPDYSAAFCRLTILTLLIDTIAEPLWKTVQASGDIKRYQLTVSLILLCNLPLAYLLLLEGFSPVWVFIIKLGLNLVAYLYRFHYCRRLIDIPIKHYLNRTIVPIASIVLLMVLLAFSIAALRIHYIFGSLIIAGIASLLVLFVGLSKNERKYAFDIVKGRICKIMSNK